MAKGDFYELFSMARNNPVFAESIGIDVAGVLALEGKFYQAKKARKRRYSVEEPFFEFHPDDLRGPKKKETDPVVLEGPNGEELVKAPSGKYLVKVEDKLQRVSEWIASHVTDTKATQAELRSAIEGLARVLIMGNEKGMIKVKPKPPKPEDPGSKCTTASKARAHKAKQIELVKAKQAEIDAQEWDSDVALNSLTAAERGAAKSKAMSRVLRDRGPQEEVELVAATIYSALHEFYSEPEIMGMVCGVVTKILSRSGWVPGRKQIEAVVGSRLVMLELAAAICYDALDRVDFSVPKSFPDCMNQVLDTSTLKCVRNDGGVSAEKWLSDLVDLKRGEVHGDKAVLERKAKILNRFSATFACRKASITVESSHKEDTTTFVPTCNSSFCPSCWISTCSREYDAVLAKWQALGGQIWQVKCPLGGFGEISEFRDYMRKLNLPKHSVIGVDSDGVYVLYSLPGKMDQHYVVSLAEGFQAFKWRESDDVKEVPPQSAKRALVEVIKAKVSLSAYFVDCILAGDDEAVFEYAKNIYRKQIVVARSKKSLPWISKQEMRSLKRGDAEVFSFKKDFPDEKYKCVHTHVETGIKFAEGEFPLSIEVIAWHLEHNVIIHEAMRAKQIAKIMSGRPKIHSAAG